MQVPLANGAIEASCNHSIRIKGVNLCLLYLISVPRLCGEERSLCSDVKLDDLTILKLYKVNLIAHSLNVRDALFRDYHDFFLFRTRSIIYSQGSRLRRAN